MGRGQKKGFRHREETVARIAATMKGRTPLAIHIKRQCPSCDVWMGAGNMGRHAPACAAKKESGIFPEKSVFEMKQMRRKLRPYGLTPADYFKLWQQQGGVCSICGDDNETRELAVNHCHETNVVRGLLCDLCNQLLGMARDRQEILLRAAQYLAPFQFDRDGCDSAIRSEPPHDA